MNLVPKSITNPLSACLKGLSSIRKDDLIALQVRQGTVMRQTRHFFNVAVYQTARNVYHNADIVHSGTQELGLVEGDILHVILFSSESSKQSMLSIWYRSNAQKMT